MSGLVLPLITKVPQLYRKRWGRALIVLPRVEYRSVWTLAVPGLLTASALKNVPNINPNQIHSWLTETHDAADFGESEIRLYFESRTTAPITIDRIAAHIERRTTERMGALVKSPSAGALSAVLLGIDLSSDPPAEPVEVHRDGFDEWTETPYFRDRSIDIDPGKSEPINIQARSAGDAVAWRIQVQYRVAGRARQLMYPPTAERPFLTVALPKGSFEQFWLCGVAGLTHRPYLRECSSDWL
jgi:hypothetical protein